MDTAVAPEAARASLVRSHHLDNAKALLIVLVVLGHVLDLHLVGVQPYRSLSLFIYTFHMPAFAFVAGMLSRPDAWTPRGAWSLARLLLVFAAFQSLHAALTYRATGGISLTSAIVYQGYAMWWLVALMAWRLVLPAFDRLAVTPRLAFAAVGAASVLSAASGYVAFDGARFSFSRILVFLPFFVAGFSARRFGWSLPKNLATRATALVAFAAAALAIPVLGDFVTFPWLMGRHTFAEMDASGIAAAAHRLVLLAASGVLVAAFLQLVPRRRLWVTALGATTLSVYLWHSLIIVVLKNGEIGWAAGGTPVRVLVLTAILVLGLGFGPMTQLTDALLKGDPRRWLAAVFSAFDASRTTVPAPSARSAEETGGASRG